MLQKATLLAIGEPVHGHSPPQRAQVMLGLAFAATLELGHHYTGLIKPRPQYYE